jgi:hypothetical protein
VIDAHKPRDMALLDALDKLPRLTIQQRVWRTVRDGRDPLEGSRSRGRWVYTSHLKDGSIAEIYALLSAQPVFPSKVQWLAYELQVELANVASLPTLPELAGLGVDVARYQHREYERTQEVADAALFLGFDGLITPSARWDCTNLVVFTESIDPGQTALGGPPDRVDWDKWREFMRTRPRA